MDNKPSRARARGALLLVLLLGAGLRSLDLPQVFVRPGEVVLAMDDAAYHARRAFYSFENFPKVLFFDPYLAYPSGAPVPLPPGFDWMLGGVARMFGSDALTFERVAAWWSPLMGCIALLAVYAVARRLAGATAGWIAAGVYAVLPVPAVLARVGNPDHHAAVAALAALWLWLWVRELETPGARSAWRAVAHALACTAMVLTWSGSLLFVGLADGVGLVAAVGLARVDVVARLGAASLAAAALLVPIVWQAGEPVGGPFSSTTLSWLHVLVLASLGALSLTWTLWERRARAASTGVRWIRALVLATAVALPSFLLFPIRASLLPGAEFVAGADEWAITNPEQQPIFAALARVKLEGAKPAYAYYGAFAYLLPLLPLVWIGRLRNPASCGPASVLLSWSVVLGFLAVTQVRFGNEFAVPFAISVGVGSVECVARLLPRLRSGPREVVAGIAVLALLAPGIAGYHAVRWRASRSRLESGSRPNAPLPHSEARRDFMLRVRALTPETSGYGAGGGHPEYGVLTPAPFGHSTVYWAHRATPAGNLGPYLDTEKWKAVQGFFAARTEADALQRAEALGTRYVVTSSAEAAAKDSVAGRLHRDLGVPAGPRGHLGRFRLLTQSRQGGGFRLFEIVPGALLEADAPPGTPVQVSLALRGPGGIVSRFRARGRAGTDSRIQIRVPYSTGKQGDVEALRPYEVRLRGATYQVRVDPEDVSQGRSVWIKATLDGA